MAVAQNYMNPSLPITNPLDPYRKVVQETSTKESGIPTGKVCTKSVQ